MFFFFSLSFFRDHTSPSLFLFIIPFLKKKGGIRMDFKDWTGVTCVLLHT